MSASNWKRNARLFTELRTAPNTTGIYVRKSGLRAVVNVGDGSLSVPVQGKFRPFPGDPVVLEWRNRVIYMTGPAGTKSNVGTVTAVGNPLLTVKVGFRTYKLPFAVSYDDATVGDKVGISWADQDDTYVTGRISGTAEADDVEEKITLDQHDFTLYFFAKQSGSYGNGTWRYTDVKAHPDYVGAWFYGDQLRKTLRDDAYISSVEIYLPLKANRGTAYPLVGRHTDDVRPHDSTSITDEDQLSDLDPRNKGRKGWFHLPTAWADLWRNNEGGVGIAHGGDSTYAGLSSDRQSGKLRIRGRQ